VSAKNIQKMLATYRPAQTCAAISRDKIAPAEPSSTSASSRAAPLLLLLPQ
jgi:hypothetical protein